MALREIAAEAFDLLRLYDWPGNVRELHNVLERASMLSDEPRLGIDDFVSILRLPDGGATVPVQRYDDALAEFERRAIRDALQITRGKVPEAAKLLGMGRATLYKKLVALGIPTR